MTEEAVPTVVTQHPSSDPLVLTAPLNTPVSFDQLLANSAGGANLQAQITALAARVTALENAAGAGEASSTASEGGSHERHRDHTARPGSGHRHS